MHGSGRARVGRALPPLFLLFILAATVAGAQTTEPEQVRPSTGTFSQLRKASDRVAVTIGEYFDEGHDWLYRRLEHWLERVDTWFIASGQEPIVVPLSPLRIGVDAEFLHRSDGQRLAATPDFEATLRLPNIGRRLNLFVTSSDVQESPVDSALERGPVRAGLRFAPLAHVELELGAHAKIWPVAFAALRWNPGFQAGALKVYPFAKVYVESGLGIGVSSGLTLERWQGRWIARSASYANWVRNTSATDWTQTFVAGYAQAVIHEHNYGTVAAGRDLACGVALRLSVGGDRVSRTTAYESSVIIKRPLHGGWLYAYVEPVARWERAYRWHPDLGVRIGFDALLWGLSAPSAEPASPVEAASSAAVAGRPCR